MGDLNRARTYNIGKMRDRLPGASPRATESSEESGSGKAGHRAKGDRLIRREGVR